jgi:hypothetical protein
MRKLYLLIFACISVSFYQCSSPGPKPNTKIVEVESRNEKDTFQLLCQYWQLLDAENPTSKDIPFTNNNGVQFESGIIFMTDSTLLENPAGEMTYGKFVLNENEIKVDFDNGKKAEYKIEKLSKEGLVLKRSQNKHTSQLTYKATDTYWKNAEKSSFAKKNYQWVVKPAKPETNEQIKKRAKDCVKFYAYYFKGFADGGATKINFEGLPCCFNWYQGGISIQNEKKLDKKWINCFYSEEQAFTARQILQDALMKKYDWDTTETNWVKQTAQVLQQIHDRM